MEARITAEGKRLEEALSQRISALEKEMARRLYIVENELSKRIFDLEQRVSESGLHLSADLDRHSQKILKKCSEISVY